MDEIAENTPIVVTGIQTPQWELGAAGKKVGWAMVAWKSAVASGVAVAPLAVAVIEKVSGITQPYGITIHINNPVFEATLPIFLFAGLVSAHDYAKLKFSDKPVAKFL